MKTLILFSIAIIAAFSFSACTTVEDRREPSHVTTTTTEETTLRHPVLGTTLGTTETKTTRSY